MQRRKIKSMSKSDIWVDRLGRALLSFLFFAGAVQKVIDPTPVMEMLGRTGLPPILVWPLAVFNLCAAVMLVLGLRLRSLGFVLAGYCLLTSFFHLNPQEPWQISIMVKNWAIAGCLLMIATRQRKV